MTDALAPAASLQPIAKPWYLSKTVLSLVAGLIMAVAPKVAQILGISIPLSPEQADAIAAFVLPQAIALWGRLTTKTVLTTGAATAAAINAGTSSIAGA